MNIFFASSKRGNLFSVKDEELRHLRVKRVKPSEYVGLIWEEKLYLCKFREAKKGEVLFEAVKELEAEKPPVKLHLYQAITVELKTFDFIVQKATELGVFRIVPLITERSFRNIKVVEKRMERWTRISKEAMKQSGRVYPLEIGRPLELSSLEARYELNVLLDNFYEGTPIGELRVEEGAEVGVVVGPEGGFSSSEGQMLRERGFVSVKMRPHVLRSETAVIVGVGFIMNLAGS